MVIIGYAHCMLLEHRYLAGIPLAGLDGEIRRKRQVAELFRHDNLAVNTNIYSSVADALLGLAAGLAGIRSAEARAGRTALRRPERQTPSWRPPGSAG